MVTFVFEPLGTTIFDDLTMLEFLIGFLTLRFKTTDFSERAGEVDVAGIDGVEAAGEVTAANPGEVEAGGDTEPLSGATPTLGTANASRTVMVTSRLAAL